MAAIAAVLVLALACAPPPKRVTGSAVTLPSPSPTPTAALTASSAPFHAGEVGIAYATVALSATGGVAPYKWSVSAGSLPDGLTLAGDGSVAGTPAAAGTFAFTIQVADNGDSKASIPGTIGIAPALAVSLIPSCAQYCRVELGCADVCGAFGTQSGGAGPYAYSLTQGPLPAGTSLNQLSLAGTFKGTSGFLKFAVQVSDAMGATASVAPTFWMYDHISMASGHCYYQPRLPCQTTLAYSGGTPFERPAVAVVGWVGGSCGFIAVVTCPQPPFSATASGGIVSITVGPVSPNDYPYPNGTFTLKITAQDPCGSNATCTASGAQLTLRWTG